MTHEKRIRNAALLVFAGLLVQLVTTLFWSPLNFVLFTIVGVPLILLGIGLYLVTVLKILKAQKAL